MRSDLTSKKDRSYATDMNDGRYKGTIRINEIYSGQKKVNLDQRKKMKVLCLQAAPANQVYGRTIRFPDIHPIHAVGPE
jgi:hypothetical protein